jgi:CRISPR-associated Csx14 family protein
MTSGLRTLPATLIATLGTEPQVVTAASDLLQRQGQSLSQVIVLHSLSPGTLIAEAVEKLRHEFDNPSDHDLPPLKLVQLADKDGQTLEDVKTPVESQAAFRVIYNQVRMVKKAGNRVHLCIAGGRKTMALFGMLSAQLLFDEDDRLWHLYSGGEFLESKRMHPQANDDVHLIPIPVVQWSTVSPMLLDLGEIEDPFEALSSQRELRLAERMEDARSFVRGALTPAEERVVALLVKEGMSDSKIANQLVLSSRTVEEHLRSAYQKAEAHWELEDVNRTHLIVLLNLYYTFQTTPTNKPRNTGNPA